ncbi:MAG: alpha/beta hydrolase [Acidimicrobiia bacterium]|jgi:pimeloyl-ACP methyl ester carboxylesterase
MRDITVEVPGGSINVWHRPASAGADTAVLVHGLTGTSRWWANVIDHLPVELGLIAIDVRGRGGSFDAPPPFDLATYAEDIVRCLDRFEVERALVAGYSMGGWVVGVLADHHPDRVDRLVLVDGGLGLPQNPDLDPDDIIEAIVGPSLARLNVVFEDEEAFYDYWKAHPALERHWDDAMRPAFRYELRETDSGYSVVANPDAIKESARQITVDPETRNVCAGVTVPSHFIAVERGTADEDGGMTPLATAEQAAAANPNLTMEYLTGLNHYTVMLGAGAKLVAAAIVGD